MKTLLIALALAVVLVPPPIAQAEVVTDGNQTALRATEMANMPPPVQDRVMAMGRAALSDAINALDKHHAVYAVTISAPPGASMDTAVAPGMVVRVFPAQLAVTDAALATSLLPWAAAAQTADTTRLGTVHFPTSCNDEAQKRFDQAMAYQHSFWYQASYQAFQDVLKADPSCAIAYWGIALSHMRIPWIPPSPENLAQGWAAVQKGKALGAKTEHERDYIDAIAAFYTDSELH